MGPFPERNCLSHRSSHGSEKRELNIEEISKPTLFPELCVVYQLKVELKFSIRIEFLPAELGGQSSVNWQKLTLFL